MAAGTGASEVPATRRRLAVDDDAGLASVGGRHPLDAPRAKHGSIVILLAAAHADPTTLVDGAPAAPRPTPTSLLRVSDAPEAGQLLTRWHAALSRLDDDALVLVATNAHCYPALDRWAATSGIPRSRIVDTGATLGDARTRVAAVQTCLRRASALVDDAQDRDVVIAATDALPQDEFLAPEGQLARGFRSLKTDGISTVFTHHNDESGSEALRVSSGGLVVSFDLPAAGCSSPVLYLLAFDAAGVVMRSPALQGAAGGAQPAIEGVVRALVDAAYDVRAVRLEAPFPIGGNEESEVTPTIETALRLRAKVTALCGSGRAADAGAYLPAHVPPEEGVVYSRGYARCGFMGNPSDGFNGGTLSFTIANYWAECWLWESRDLVIVPHAVYDQSAFSDVDTLHSMCQREGYSGGRRLLLATCKRLFEHMRARGEALPKRNFTVRYDTNVPRQVGLAGSSAIITAFLRGLLKFFGFGSGDALAAVGLGKSALASFVLAIETEELGVQAGLQDRVAQAYGGVVYMDFDKAIMEATGAGKYEALPAATLPPLFLAYAHEASDSGKVHAPVKTRWLEGDPAVLDGMSKLAGLARTLFEDLASEPPRHDRIGDLMTRNFALRRSMYGDHLGETNMDLVRIATEAGASAKFPGSGGAAIVYLGERGGAGDVAGHLAERAAALAEAYEAAGYVLVSLQPTDNLPDA